MDGRQDDMRRHRSDDMGFMCHVRRAGIGRQPVGLGGGGGCDVVLHEGVQRLGAIIRDRRKPHPPERQLLLLCTLDLDRTDDEELAVVTASWPAGRWIVLGAKGNCGLIDLDQTAERRLSGRDQASIAATAPARPWRGEVSWPGATLSPDFSRACL
jgi:hypothetical protein